MHLPHKTLSVLDGRDNQLYHKTIMLIYFQIALWTLTDSSRKLKQKEGKAYKCLAWDGTMIMLWASSRSSYLKL